ncbi:MAG: aspartate--tRNA ligase [Oscillospiraceae bacterium]|jgi:aspartyl-tRNA synthetase|nr:aspartate--tRNA ligase [Oscillospiraceae bacterium]
MKYKRTNYCGKIFSKHIGKKVTVCGWVVKQRNLGHLIFVDLRDITGIVQLNFSKKDISLFEKASLLKSEFVIIAVGKVMERSNKNKNLLTGNIEIKVSKLEICSKAETTPFEIVQKLNVKEELRLQYRYLDLRRKNLAENFIMRHKILKFTREHFDKYGFFEIETPVLTKSTIEGARDYLVPSRVFPGKFFALPQSPQLYKQLAMIAGFDRYIQIAKCFRDEDLRSDRQPEFTQIDLEMSFADEEDIMTVVENFIKKLFKKFFSKTIKLPLRKISYDECIEKYGSDKPDLRYEMKLIHLDDELSDTNFKIFKDAINSGGSVVGVKAENAAKSFSRKEIEKLSEKLKTYGAKGLVFTKLDKDGTVSSSFEKFLSQDEKISIRKKAFIKSGDILFVVADKVRLNCFYTAGNLRFEIAKKLKLLENKADSLFWVTDFPMFVYSECENRLVAAHHPFTAPQDEDLEFLETYPEKIKARAYDLVLNGNEIGGGSIRINNIKLQMEIFKVLGINKNEVENRFGFLLNALRFGTPPHGGFAFGFDRLLMILLGCESIKDVIFFPKASNSFELMSSSPSEVYKSQLKALKISVCHKNKKS